MVSISTDPDIQKLKNEIDVLEDVTAFLAGFDDFDNPRGCDIEKDSYTVKEAQSLTVENLA